MDARLNVIEFHDCLHGFLAGKGVGTATIESKLLQQRAYTIAVYDAMDWELCVLIMEAYRVGPNMLHLIESFWENTELICRA